MTLQDTSKPQVEGNDPVTSRAPSQLKHRPTNRRLRGWLIGAAAAGVFIGAGVLIGLAAREMPNASAPPSSAGGTWLNVHRDVAAWMHAHPGDWGWMQEHWSDMQWMRHHWSGMAWLRAHSGAASGAGMMGSMPMAGSFSEMQDWMSAHGTSWDWMRQHWDSMSWWMTSHWGEMQWLHEHWSG